MPIVRQDSEGIDGLAVAPSMDLAAESAAVVRRARPFDPRIWLMCLLAIMLGVIAAWVAQALTALIHLATNVAFFGRIDTVFRSPADHARGLFVLAIPSIGGLIVGLMARFGSSAIRGHGIPEAMDQVLSNQSRTPARMTLLNLFRPQWLSARAGPSVPKGPSLERNGQGSWQHSNGSES